MIGESYSGDLQMLWSGGQHFICSRSHSDFGNYLLLTRFNCLLQGTGSSEGHIGLPALQPVPCLSGLCMGRDRHGCLVYKYTWSIGNCATLCNIPVPLACCSLVAFI